MNCEVNGKLLTQKHREVLLQTASVYDGLSSELFALTKTLEDIPNYDPHSKLYSLVRTAEGNTIQLRNLTARAMSRTVGPFYESLASAMGFSVVEEHRWIKITVPAILPSRNPRDNTSYITRPLRNCLIEFQRKHPLERFKDCGICIVHQYDAALGIRRVRDYDNIETKRYLDVIESIMLTNDSGLLCSVLQTTQIGDCDCTEFYLMQPESLSVWAKDRVKSNT